MVVHYWVKAYDEGSQYGIDGGRISKATLKISGEVLRHDGQTYARGSRSANHHIHSNDSANLYRSWYEQYSHPRQ